MVGVGIQGIQNGQAYNAAGSCCIFNSNGIYENGASKNYHNYSSITQGSIIGVLFMPHKGKIVFDVDGTHVYTAKVLETHLDAGLYPFVFISHQNSSASFI